MNWDSDCSNSEENASVNSPETSDFLENPSWPLTTLATLEAELSDASEPNAQDMLLCKPSLLSSLRSHKLDPESVRPQLSLGRPWRRLYTDAVLFRALDILVNGAPKAEKYPATTGFESKETERSATNWEEVVRLLDLAIILSGAPGEGRLELVHSCIAFIQHRHLPLNATDNKFSPTRSCRNTPHSDPSFLTQPVSKNHPPPSFAAFPALAQRPFILPGFANDWPAVEKWKSAAYLASCAGRGRVVPVERGGDYRDEDWGVDLMRWESFLEGIGWSEAESMISDSEVENYHEDEGNIKRDSEGLYLAQHSLFTQFPKLRADILVPDYVYTSPGTKSQVYSGPPGNDEQLVINAWCGGRGANSPAHTDPYYNIYVQVVGHKSIWLTPPEAAPGMYAYGKPTEHENTHSSQDPKREGMLGNTSSVDVFALSTRDQNPLAATDIPTPDLPPSAHPLFYKHALPLAQSTTLGPGDALIIPPGWWHAMRGVGGGSFSVSFWF